MQKRSGRLIVSLSGINPGFDVPSDVQDETPMFLAVKASLGGCSRKKKEKNAVMSDLNM